MQLLERRLPPEWNSAHSSFRIWRHYTQKQMVSGEHEIPFVSLSFEESSGWEEFLHIFWQLVPTSQYQCGVKILYGAQWHRSFPVKGTRAFLLSSPNTNPPGFCMLLVWMIVILLIVAAESRLASAQIRYTKLSLFLLYNEATLVTNSIVISNGVCASTWFPIMVRLITNTHPHLLFTLISERILPPRPSTHLR
jgi:hypothetical protein